MQYLGGKAKIGTRIADAMAVPPSATYYEPFCGMLGVLRHVRCRRRVASDARLAVITFWRAVQAGWLPPTTLDEDGYAALKAADDPLDPRTAWAAAGCSFGGRWWGGFARGHTDPSVAHRAAAEAVPHLRGVEFVHRDYADLDPDPGSVVYCDPPYAGTTDYPDVGPFDHRAFWRTASRWSRASTVYVSEFTGPSASDGVAAEDIWATRRRIAVESSTGANRKRDDRLYLLGGARPAQAGLFARRHIEEVHRGES